MRVTLLTGLDGSGKSTFLSYLKMIGDNSILFLHLPHIQYDDMEDGQVKDASAFITKTSIQADQVKSIPLKSFALFGSMLLFKKLSDLLTGNVRQIICERHPLIDSQVYARFYAERLAPGNLNTRELDEFYQNNHTLVDYLVSQSGVPVEGTGNRVLDTLQFIYESYFVRKQWTLEFLKEVFRVDVPDNVYYLRAEPDVLINRLQDRENKEPHEALEVLQLLDKVYIRVLNDSKINYKIIDTTSYSETEITRICQEIII